MRIKLSLISITLIFLLFCPVHFIGSLYASWEYCSGPRGGVSTYTLYWGNTLFAGDRFSSDSGLSWNKLQNISNVTQMITFATSLFAITPSKIWKSTDEGNSWSPLSVNAQMPKCITVCSNNIIVGSYNALLISKDIGTTWINYPLNGNQQIFPSVNAFTVNSSKVYAGTQNGIFRSIDAGISWDTVYPSGFNYKRISCVKLVNDSVLLVSIDSVGAYLIYEDKKDLAYPVNWHFTKVSDGLPSDTFTDIEQVNDSIYISTLNKGIYRSIYPQLLWKPFCNNLWNTSVNNLYTKDNILYCATTGGGVFKYNFTDTTWQNLGFDNIEVTSILPIDTALVVGTKSLGICFDISNQWHFVTTSKNSIFKNYNAINSLISYDNKVFAGGGDLYMSNDISNGWELITNGLLVSSSYDFGISSTNLLTASGNGIYKFDTLSQGWSSITNNNINTSVYSVLCKDSTILAGTQPYFPEPNGGFYRSVDNGKTWIHIIEYDTSTILKMATRDNMIFAITDNNGVLFSNDNGNNWQQTAVSLKNYILTDILITSNFIFVSTVGNGVFVSNNYGNSWYKLIDGLVNANINCMGADTKYLYAGLIGDDSYVIGKRAGVWRYSLDSLISITHTKSNATRRFIKTIPKYSVYNLLGRKIPALSINNKNKLVNSITLIKH